MSEPVWVTIDQVVALNAAVVRSTGEDHGLVHPEKLDAALNRPRQHFYYGPEDDQDDLVLLGAKLCVGVSESQGFIQGNKRTGFAAMEMFFNLNGFEVTSGARGFIAQLILDSAHPNRDLRLSEEDFAERLDDFVLEREEDDFLAGGMWLNGAVNSIQQAMSKATDFDDVTSIEVVVITDRMIDPKEPPTLEE